MHRIDVETVAVNRLRMKAFQTCGRVKDSKAFNGSKKVRTVVRGNTIYARVIAERTTITTLNPRCVNSILTPTALIYSELRPLVTKLKWDMYSILFIVLMHCILYKCPINESSPKRSNWDWLWVD